MAIKSMFPEVIEYDGSTWHMVYDPNCPSTVMPSINEKDVQRVTYDAVSYPGRTSPVWVAMAFIVIPSRTDSVGNLIGARRMLGFRTFDRQPPTTYPLQPNELVYYVAEQSDGSAAQRFFNAVTGIGQPSQDGSGKPDTSWCKQFSELKRTAAQEIPSLPVQEGVGNETA